MCASVSHNFCLKSDGPPWQNLLRFLRFCLMVSRKAPLDGFVFEVRGTVNGKSNEAGWKISYKWKFIAGNIIQLRDFPSSHA